VRYGSRDHSLLFTDTGCARHVAARQILRERAAHDIVQHEIWNHGGNGTARAEQLQILP
jgi:hypothetical protein